MHRTASGHMHRVLYTGEISRSNSCTKNTASDPVTCIGCCTLARFLVPTLVQKTQHRIRCIGCCNPARFLVPTLVQKTQHQIRCTAPHPVICTAWYDRLRRRAVHLADFDADMDSVVALPFEARLSQKLADLMSRLFHPAGPERRRDASADVWEGFLVALWDEGGAFPPPTRPSRRPARPRPAKVLFGRFAGAKNRQRPAPHRYTTRSTLANHRLYDDGLQSHLWWIVTFRLPKRRFGKAERSW